MKKSQLVKIIKDAVREELKSSLPTIIKEVIGADKKIVPIPTVDPVEITKQVLKNTPGRGVSSPPKEMKRFTKNEALNRVLNETVGGVPQEGASTGTGETTDFNGNPVDVDALPDHVSNALTRDYSGLLRAVDKKKGTSA